MSVPSLPARESVIQPVRPVGANGWLISFSVERVETRARHGRARWSLSSGMRRRPASLK